MGAAGGAAPGGDDGQVAATASQGPAPASAPVRAARSDPDAIDLYRALRALPFGQRQVLVLHHLAGLPVAEVAAELGLPTGTVKARLSRGRAALARRLDPTSQPTQEQKGLPR